MSGPKLLVDLKPSWVYLCDDGISVRGIIGKPDPEWLHGKIVGVSFSCPLCPSGHRIAIPFEECPLEAGWLSGKGVRWKRSGDTLENLTAHPSINCDHGGSCKFHGWIKNGEVTW